MMVGKVLKIAAYEKNQLDLKIQKVDLNEIIEKVNQNFEVQVSHKGGRIEKELNLEDTIIEADKEHITNVIFNLLDNANKYCNREPVIRIKTEDLQGNIKLSISDNGIGIPKNHLKSIFNKFYRIPNSHLNSVKGFGLGLNYVHKIIEQHKGEINVISDLNKGSTFEIILPKKHE